MHKRKSIVGRTPNKYYTTCESCKRKGLKGKCTVVKVVNVKEKRTAWRIEHRDGTKQIMHIKTNKPE